MTAQQVKQTKTKKVTSNSIATRHSNYCETLVSLKIAVK